MGLHERVYLVEDDDMLAELATWYLEKSGHIIIGHSKNLKDALNGIKEAKEQGATVAVVDGNLTPWKNDCEEGKKVAQAIREQAPGLSVIAYSLSPETSANYGDIYVYKGGSGDAPKRLAETVSAIPR